MTPTRMLMTVEEVTLVFMQEYGDKAYDRAIEEIVNSREERNRMTLPGHRPGFPG